MSYLDRSNELSHHRILLQKRRNHWLLWCYTWVAGHYRFLAQYLKKERLEAHPKVWRDEEGDRRRRSQRPQGILKKGPSHDQNCHRNDRIIPQNNADHRRKGPRSLIEGVDERRKRRNPSRIRQVQTRGSCIAACRLDSYEKPLLQILFGND